MEISKVAHDAALLSDTPSRETVAIKKAPEGAEA
jgi:hypothetical protein